MTEKVLINKTTEERISRFKEFFEVYKKDINLTQNPITLDLNLLLQFNPGLYEEILDNPSLIINEMEVALEEKISFPFKILLANINNEKQIRKIRSEDIEKLVSLKGIIKRITKVIPRAVSLIFECPACGAEITCLQIHKKKQEPTRCSCGRKGNFHLIETKNKNIQELNLEEISEELEGKQPQQIRVYLEGNLTEDTFSKKLRPGRKIEIIGQIDLLPPFMTPKDEESNLSEFMVYANNIIPLEEDDEIIISEEDKKQIMEIASNDPLSKLARSLIPEVYGNEQIKKAIILQLVKGVPKLKSDRTYTREDIHILLVGDPGLAKSITLKATQERTPGARMVIGTKTSRVGLGAMTIKNETLGTWELEVGNLILANNSLLCIDELDKMHKENLSELLEPMSSGCVTIAKAGIFAKLPSRTSILASANPIQGNYDLMQPIAKQIDLPSPILNRFDLIFVMIDKPDIEFDKKAVEHVFNMQTKSIEPEIPTLLFKKYISYCRKLKPQLKPELSEKLKNFYINLRQRSKSKDEQGLPINLRNMEGILRLSEASAKLRFSNEVEIQDFDVAKSIFMYCLKQVGIDNETGMVDTSRVTERVPISKRGKVEKLREILYNLADRFGKEIPIEEILNKTTEFKSWEVSDFLGELNRLGEIIEIRKGVFMLNG